MPVNQDIKVTLREFIEQRLDAMDKALALQAIEYARRLESLNHAHKEAVQVQQTYIPRETFDLFVIEYRKEHQLLKDMLINSVENLEKSVNVKITTIDKWQTQQEAVTQERQRINTWRLGLVSLALVVIGLVARFFKF